MSKELKFIYGKIYNGGKYTKLISKINIIKDINHYYRDNFESYNDFNQFYNSMGTLKVELDKSPAAVLEFSKQFHKRLALQPGILTECFISQTIAAALDLDNFIDVENTLDIPMKLANQWGQVQSVVGLANPRYIYYNDKQDTVILQYGDSSSIDVIFVKNKRGVRIEFKEEKSRLSEPDISGLYDESGKLTPDTKFIEKYTRYLPLIELFNQETDAFSYIGHNYNLQNHLNASIIKRITDEEFHMNIIEMFIFQHKNYIYPVDPKDLFSLISFKGSEIRLSGRNSRPVFTPNYVNKVIFNLGGNIMDGEVSIPSSSLKVTIGRNRSTPSRYNINSYLFMRFEDVTVINDIAIFKYRNIKQKKPSISLHLDVIPNDDVLKNRYNSYD